VGEPNEKPKAISVENMDNHEQGHHEFKISRVCQLKDTFPWWMRGVSWLTWHLPVVKWVVKRMGFVNPYTQIVGVLACDWKSVPNKNGRTYPLSLVLRSGVSVIIDERGVLREMQPVPSPASVEKPFTMNPSDPDAVIAADSGHDEGSVTQRAKIIRDQAVQATSDAVEANTGREDDEGATESPADKNPTSGEDAPE